MNGTNQKFKFIVTIMILLVFCLAGCQSKKNEEINHSPVQHSDAKQEKLLIAAAASLEYAFSEELIPAFEKQNSNVTIDGIYDASGKLQIQIEEGLEADLFLSAAPKQMETLEQENLIDKGTKIDLLTNKIVLIVPKANPKGIKNFDEIKKVDTIALGDPDSVPVGQYSKEVLEKLGQWDGIQSKVSFGTNVTEVLNWVAEGSADVGIVYQTDAKMNDQVTVVAQAPEKAMKQEVIYPAAVIKNSEHPKLAKRFLDFLQTKEAHLIFEKYGFTPAG